MAPLTPQFYQRNPVEVALRLLGTRLVRRARDGITAGRIVEVEAYLDREDAACHAARGPTRSNAAMFGPAGHAYVYPIHSRFCFNVVTQAVGQASAVLIRAVEPLDGVLLMQRRRGLSKLTDLTRGPARLCEAFAIDRSLDHWKLTCPQRLWIEGAAEVTAELMVSCSPRIGVSTAEELLLRYFVTDSPFVSGTRRLNRSQPVVGRQALLRHCTA